jgi:oligopeptide transport system ATP-binding protein
MTSSADLRPMLAVEHLSIYYGWPLPGLQVVNDVSLELHRGRIVGIVGESGSGKSQILLSIMGLLPDSGRATGRVRLLDRDILNQDRRSLDQIRGVTMAMVFQNPMTSLTPHLPIARQLTEVLVRHKGMSMAAALAESVRMLELVRIPDASQRIHRYPHEFSGGMRQRVMIAMALLCRPAVLLADEPTTALDVTVQAQLLKLFSDVAVEFGTAILLVTHDFGVVSELCDRVVVLYGGAVMEAGPTEAIVQRPRHPYTQGLLAAMPGPDRRPGQELYAIPGQVRPGSNRPGCPFCPRCTQRIPVCATERPILAAGPAERLIACHVADKAEAEA